MHTSPEPTANRVVPRLDQVIDAPGSDGNHKVSAIYATAEEAQRVRAHLVAAGIAATDLHLLQDLPLPPDVAGNDEVLKDMLVDGAIGTAVGTGVGAIGTGVLWAASVTLFVASPIVAPLAMLGWFASVGAVVGAAAGATGKDSGTRPGREGRFSELVTDAIQAGSVVLVVDTHGESDRALAKDVIGKSLAGRQDAAASSA